MHQKLFALPINTCICTLLATFNLLALILSYLETCIVQQIVFIGIEQEKGYSTFIFCKINKFLDNRTLYICVHVASMSTKQMRGKCCQNIVYEKKNLIPKKCMIIKFQTPIYCNEHKSDCRIMCKSIMCLLC